MTKSIRQLFPGLPFTILAEAHRRFDDPGLPYVVEVTVEWDEALGRFVCASLKCSRRTGRPPVTSDGMRTVNVGGITRAALVSASEVSLVNPHSNPEWKAMFENLNADPAGIGARGLSDEALRAAALVYAQAYAIGEPPVEEVAEVLEVPRSTAARWVAKAREAGYLGKTEPRKAGT